MSRASDLARIAKGAAKVAKAFVDVEAPAVAQRALRLKEHGAGLTYSVRDAVSSAMSSASQQTAPPSSAPSAHDEAAHPPPGQVQSQTLSSRLSSSTPTPPPPTPAVAGSSIKPTREDPPAVTLASASMMKPSNGLEVASEVVEQGARAAEEGTIQDVDVSIDAPPTVASTASESPPQGTQSESQHERGRKEFDESGPWAFGDIAPESVTTGTTKEGDVAVSNPPKGGMSNSRTRTVPSSPLARVFGFGQLAAGLAMGTVAEAVRQSVGGNEGEGKMEENGSRRQGGTVKQYVASDANAERLAETLCRMRGAALKLGQMLSIQDESVIPPSLAKALDRVRQGADVMPAKQLHRQLEKSLGSDWRSKLASFDETPIAAASIGQVHRARLKDGTEVAMKIQYPGVADSVESDLKNLQRLVQLTNILPPGLYIDEIIEVAREELGEECDYEKEAANQERFRKLVESDETLNRWASVPKVVPNLVSKEVLTTHLAPGVPVDQVLPMPQEVRNHVARIMLRCTINELFAWRFMQTDPNWGNFLFDSKTGKMSLIDFGACREYRKDFVDDYLRLVWSAANRDEKEIMRVSEELKFLTGDETSAMMKAHLQAGLVVGEPFVDRGGEPFDFHGSNITARLSQHGDTFMKHRLTPPPREAYSLHRKLAGAFLMNIKLKAKIPCRDILEDVQGRYTYG